jgi:hypothetical protein
MLPTIKDLSALLRSIKGDICDDCRADEFDDTPGIQVTIGWNTSGDWSYQTGDNSYSGSAYHYPHWAVVSVYRSSNCNELARDILSQLSEYLPYIRSNFVHKSSQRNPHPVIPEIANIGQTEMSQAKYVGKTVIHEKEYDAFRVGRVYYFQLSL